MDQIGTHAITVKATLTGQVESYEKDIVIKVSVEKGLSLGFKTTPETMFA
jgi:hypothetical protein